MNNFENIGKNFNLSVEKFHQVEFSSELPEVLFSENVSKAEIEERHTNEVLSDVNKTLDGNTNPG